MHILLEYIKRMLHLINTPNTCIFCKMFNKHLTHYTFLRSDFVCANYRSDVIPVVMGASKEDYQNVAPDSSFIYVDDFSSPRELAKYLLHLAANDEEYSKYFRWHDQGHVGDGSFLCDLCEKLNGFNEKSWYADINGWWQGHGVCKEPNHADFNTNFDITDFLKRPK